MPKRPRRLLRTIYAVALLAGFALIWTSLVRALDAWGFRYPVVQAESVTVMENALRRLEWVQSSGQPAAVVLGDSMAVGYDGNRTVPYRLREVLGEGLRVRGDVVNFALPGTDLLNQWALAPNVARHHPTVAILALNGSWFGRDWDVVGRPELCAMIPPSRLFDLWWLPVRSYRMTVDRILAYAGLWESGLIRPWVAVQREQARFNDAREAIVDAADELAGSHATSDAEKAAKLAAMRGYLLSYDPPRMRADAHHRQLAGLLEGLTGDEDALYLLGDIVRTFRSAGTAMVVYLTPINKEHLERVGVLDPQRWRQSVRALAATVGEAGGTFVDMSSILPDSAFRDSVGHMTVEPLDGPRTVALELAPYVRKEFWRESGAR